MVTAAQQDYLETIYRLETRGDSAKVRISDIAVELGTRLPTVTRTIRKLTELGLVLHRPRRDVALSPAGRKMASEVAHRHDDLVQFFVSVLGLRKREAEADCCQVEHGISGKTAQRLHEFLQYFNNLSKRDRQVISNFQRTATSGRAAFRNLSQKKTNGWRS